jgi:hypothetical protein
VVAVVELTIACSGCTWRGLILALSMLADGYCGRNGQKTVLDYAKEIIDKEKI